MKEAKIYDLKLKNFREQLEEYHPSIDASAKRTKIVNGIETVTQELIYLKEEYSSLLDKLLALLNQLQDEATKSSEFVSLQFRYLRGGFLGWGREGIGNNQGHQRISMELSILLFCFYFIISINFF